MKVYYFTRTGRSQKIAGELAASLGTEAIRIMDGKNWDGAWGYLKAGFMAATGKSLSPQCTLPGEAEPSIVVFPVWAGGFPPAVKGFLEKAGRQNIIAVPTSLGGTLKDRSGFAEVIDLVGKEIAAPEIKSTR